MRDPGAAQREQGHDRHHGHAQGHDHAHGHGHVHGDWERQYGRIVARRDHGPLLERPTTFWGRVRQFIWGFLYFDWYHELQHERAKYNDVFNLILFGELIGIPLMNSSIGLRLLPHVLPELQGWKHRQLEEREIIEEVPHVH